MAILWRLLLLWVYCGQVVTLRCLQCVGSSSSCRMVARKCQSYETTCISLSYRTQDSNTVMKGCATTELCNQTSIIDTGTQSFYMSATCCESDYCNINRFSTAQVYSNRLKCNICNNTITSTTSTSSTTINCPSTQDIFCDGINNNCLDIITVVNNGSVQTQSYSKSCGAANIGDTCTNLFAYDTKNYQRYTYLSCCTGNLCNSAKKTYTKLNNNNGIQCHACKDNGNNECAEDKQKTVDCKGTLLRCMEAFDKNRKTIMKGCSTVAFCSSTDLSQQDSDISEIMCCAGSLCNNFTRAYVSNSNATGTTASSTAIRNTDFSILTFFICLLSAIIRH